MDKALLLVEQGDLVDVVDVEHMTPVKLARPLVVLEVPGVVDGGPVVGGEVDFVRIRVIGFTAQAPLVLHAQTSLEAAIAAIGVVLIRADTGVALIFPVGVLTACVGEATVAS